MFSVMRSNEIFAQMSGEEALAFLDEMRKEAPDVARLSLAAAANAFRLRPEFLKRQPRPRQAEWMRRALGRTVGAPLAEEVLASYFLDYENELLVEWLDALKMEHDEGRISGEIPPCPEPKELEAIVKKFRDGENPEKRALLVKAFASQSAIQWEALDALIAGAPMPAAKAPKAPEAESKAAPKKAPAKKAAAKKATAKKATAKKATTKKAAAKKAGAKKAGAKKTAAKKATRK